MSVKEIIIHKTVIERWARSNDPPPTISMEQIVSALTRINEVMKSTPPERLIIVEESPNTGYSFLPAMVGVDNTARLFGARAAYCLRIAREVLEANRIRVTLDKQGGVLP